MVKLKFKLIFFVALFLQLCYVSNVQGQNKGAKEEAIEFFKKENYQDAYPLFVQLLDLYSSDPLTNYYYGVTKVKVGRFDQDIITSLRRSLISNQTPEDAMFYLGQAYHAFEQYEKALDAYARFEEKSKKKDQKRLEVKKYKELAYNKSNPFSLAVGRSRVERIKEEKEKEQVAKVKAEDKKEKGFTNVEDSNSSSKTINLESYDIAFNVNSTLTYRRVDDFKVPSARQLYMKGLTLKMKRMGLSERIDNLRKEFNGIEENSDSYSKSEAETKRKSLTDEIIKLEHQVYPLLKQEQQRFAQSKMIEQTYWRDYSLDQQKEYAIVLATKYDPNAVAFDDEVIEKDLEPAKEEEVEVASIPEEKEESTPSKEKALTTVLPAPSVAEKDIPVAKEETKVKEKTTIPVEKVVSSSENKTIEAPTKEERVPAVNTEKQVAKSVTPESHPAPKAPVVKKSVEKKHTTTASKPVVHNTPAAPKATPKKSSTPVNNSVKQTTVATTPKTVATPKSTAKVTSVDVPTVSFDEDDLSFDVGSTSSVTTTAAASTATISKEVVKTTTAAKLTVVKTTSSKLPEVYYAIQFAATKGDIASDVKQKVNSALPNDAIHYYMKNGARYYVVGYFTSLKEAGVAKGAMRTGGFGDAFTVALNKDGERITFDEAKKLLK